MSDKLDDILDVFARGICDFYEQNHLQEASNKAELDKFKSFIKDEINQLFREELK